MPKIISTIVKMLIMSDFVFNFGWGLLAPIFAIFIVQRIAVDDIAKAAFIVGFASSFYWITKSLLQIPIGHYLDRNHGEVDDFWFLFIGTLITALVPIGYLFSSQPWHIYLLQMLYGVAAAMMLPSFAAIFTRHINKGREAVTWSIYSTFLGFATGIAGGVGGLAVGFLGFNAVLIAISIFTVASNMLILYIRKDISPRNKQVVRIPIERK